MGDDKNAAPPIPRSAVLPNSRRFIVASPFTFDLFAAGWHGEASLAVQLQEHSLDFGVAPKRLQEMSTGELECQGRHGFLDRFSQ